MNWWRRDAEDPVLPALPAIRRRDLGHRERPVLPRAENIKWQPPVRTVEPYFEHPDYIEALAQSVERAYAELENRPDVLVPATTACRSAT
jgi:hypothetical protein